ncbi:MAG: DUF695 domain-containing protein [Acidimicrobiales bacterium]|nr:DUF695 domain-containing protein [Acidimicrobiales bacterium]
MRPEIEEFWTWWATARPSIETAIADGDWGDLPEQITSRVHAINPDLSWEFGPGEVARHCLCVTSGGLRGLRTIAERWLRAAPPADTNWEFHAARRPERDRFSTGIAFEVEGAEVEPASARFSVDVDEDRRLVHVEIFHPIFPHVPAPVRGQITFLVLEWLLGEDGIERWLGAISIAADEPLGALTPDELIEVIDRLGREPEEPTFALLSGMDADGWPLLITVRQPLKRVEYPLFDLHAEVVVCYAEQQDNGLPELGELDRLTRIEDGLLSALGDEAILAAVVSSRGRRTFHLYADAEGPAPALLESWQTVSAVDANVAWSHDPAWDAVGRFL